MTSPTYSDFDPDSDGEDYFTSSTQSEDLSRTIRGLGALLFWEDSLPTEVDQVEQTDEDGLNSAVNQGEYCLPTECCSGRSSPCVLDTLLSAYQPDSTPWSLPDGCGEASLAALMRSHLLAAPATALCSACSAETVEKLNVYTTCSALTHGPLAPGVVHPPFASLLPPTSGDACHSPRFEQYRHWLHGDRDEDGPTYPVPTPPRSTDGMERSLSPFSGRRTVSSLGSILLRNAKSAQAGQPSQPDSSRSDTAVALDDAPIHLNDNVPSLPNVMSPPLNKTPSRDMSTIAGSHSLMLTSNPSCTGLRSTTVCGSPLLQRGMRQDSVQVESVLPPISLPPLHTAVANMESSLSLRSASLVVQNTLHSSFASLPRGSGDNRGGGGGAHANRSISLFNRLFSPKQPRHSGFTARETVLCGAGSPRPQGHSAPQPIFAGPLPNNDASRSRRDSAPLREESQISSNIASTQASPVLSRQR